MKTLLLMRHGKARPDDGQLDDHERPLMPRGENAAQVIGRELVAAGLVPDLVIASTAVRAVSTARGVVRATGTPIEIRATSALYLGTPSAYLRDAARVSDDVQRLLLVGHNPGLEELVSDLAGTARSMPTAALAAFELGLASWSELDRDTAARLVGVYLAREPAVR